MIKKTLFLLLLVMHGLANYAQEQKADSTGYIVFEGDIAPDFKISLIDGTSIQLSDLRGKVVMLQFTASWCGVCRKEMPYIEREIWQLHKDNPDFYLLGIDRDEPIETVLKFKETTRVTYPLGLDPNADIFSKYALKESGITRNVLIDRDGRIIMKTRLFNMKEFNSLKQEIDKQLSLDVKSLQSEAFDSLLKTTNITLLDVRTEEEYKEAHLTNSINIDIYDQSFIDKVQNTIPKTSPIAIYCRSGRRSLHAAQLLKEEGYQVYNLKGGILDWQAKGYKTQLTE